MSRFLVAEDESLTEQPQDLSKKSFMHGDRGRDDDSLPFSPSFASSEDEECQLIIPKERGVYIFC
jgi:hypothetical protein